MERFTVDNAFWHMDEHEELRQNHQEAWLHLVPDRGPAETIQGEILRLANALYYDHWNNGSCNSKVEEADKLVHLSDHLDGDIKTEYRQKAELVRNLLSDAKDKDVFYIWDAIDTQEELTKYEEALEFLIREATEFAYEE